MPVARVEGTNRPLRIAALIKQIPKFEEMELGPDGRLRRDGLDLEMNPYCRRAVSKGVELARASGGTCTAMTLGPVVAEATLREAIAWGADDGVLITDAAFGGSDTLATARALAAALELEGPFDLVLVGRNSVDADTGQVGPELAELLGLPFAAGVRELQVFGETLALLCEHDDGWTRVEVALPAVLSAAERLCEPCKVDEPERAAVSSDRLRRKDAAMLGPGPWGQAASATTVGAVRVHSVERTGARAPTLAIDLQVQQAVQSLVARGAIGVSTPRLDDHVVAPTADTAGAPIVVVIEPDRHHLSREMLGTAVDLAGHVGGRVVAVTVEHPDAARLGSWGADDVVHLSAASTLVEEDIAHELADWCVESPPWAVIAPSTVWGREVAARAAARLEAGLTGDAVALEVDGDRLIAWKPAFGGQLVAAVSATSPVQMTTVRSGVLPLPAPRVAAPATVITRKVDPRSRLRVLERTRDDDLDVLAEARVLVGVGGGIQPADYGELGPLTKLLNAELGATRKVTDRGWLPRGRQIGITGRSVAPDLYVALGLAGKFNHVVGVREAGTVLAINLDPDAPIFDCADVGIVGDWREVLPVLVSALVNAMELRTGR